MKKTRNGIKIAIVISVMVIASIASLFMLTQQTFTYAHDTFNSDGYILVSVANDSISSYGEGVSANTQYYFNKDETYINRQDGTISFNTINGDSVSVDPDNFVHYYDLSMSALKKTVLMDTDSIYNDQLVYYSITKNSILEKRNSGYAVTSGSELINVNNFIWKLSANKYTVVSNTIKLVVAEDSFQTFQNFVQVEYLDDGVVHIVNQDGTYSTISSGAYLELENGIRIYLGSKNISDSEGILMNLGQMIVNSDDEVESNPDEQFKKETDKTPRIIVEASDGKDGENGENGENGKSGEPGEAGKNGENGENGENGKNGQNGQNGQNGTQGAAGAPGTPGGGGENGDDGTNSGISFTEETMPIFTADLVPTSYGVRGTIDYTLINCEIDELSSDTYVSIIETATGSEVWRAHPGTSSFAALKGTFECNTLKQNTNYTFSITCKYKPLSTDTFVTQTLYNKFFSTKTVGIELKLNYTEQNKIVARIEKTEDTVVKSFSVFCYESTKQEAIGQGIPTSVLYDEDNQQLVPFDTNSKYTIYLPSEMQVGDSMEIEIIAKDGSRINNNTVYYLRIEDVEVNDGIIDEAIKQCITDSFPYVRVKTLKETPTLEAPNVSIVERRNGFVISPMGVVDNDQGIISYTYEVYKATDIETDANSIYGYKIKTGFTPAFSTTQTSATELFVSLQGNSNLERDGIYFARIVAKFDNNDAIVNIISPKSENFSAGDAYWPVVNNEYYATASTIQGTITILDEKGIINADGGLNISYNSIATGSDVEYISGTIDIPQSVYTEAKSTGEYRINYFISGLKEDSAYMFNILAKSMTIKDFDGNVTIGTATVDTCNFKTLKYEDINLTWQKVEGADQLHYKVSLESGSTAEEKAKASSTVANIYAKAAGINSYTDFAAKSMQYISVALYKQGDYEEPIAERAIIGEVGSSGFVFGTSLYSQYYGEGKYLDISTAFFEYKLTDDPVEKQRSINLGQYQKVPLEIKIEIYDYCYIGGYGDGSGFRTGKFLNNNKLVLVNNSKEVYFEIAPPPKPEDFESTQLKKSQVILNGGANGANSYGATSPNSLHRSNNESASSQTSLAKIWEDVYNDTEVGVEVHGNNTMVKYANFVRYRVYKNYDETTETYSGLVTESEFLGKDSNNKWIKWAFFYGITDKAYGNETLDPNGIYTDCVNRGEKYYIVAEYKLKELIKSGVNNNEYNLFPTDFQEELDGYVTVEKEGDVTTKIHPYYISQEYTSKKQLPTFFAIEKNGLRTIGEDLDTTTLDCIISYVDIDNTVVLDDATSTSLSTTDVPQFYVGNDEDITEIGNIPGASISVYEPKASETAAESNKYLIDNLTFSISSKYLYVKYDISDGNGVQSIELLSGSNYIPRYSETVSIVDYTAQELPAIPSETFKVEKGINVAAKGDNLVFSVAVQSESYYPFGGINIIFNKKVGGVKDTSPQSTYEIKNADYDIDGDNLIVGGKRYYIISVSVKASLLKDFLEDQTIFCTMELLYDTGNFGIDYVTENTASTDYGYALQRNPMPASLELNSFVDGGQNSSASDIKRAYSLLTDVSKANDLSGAIVSLRNAIGDFIKYNFDKKDGKPVRQIKLNGMDSYFAYTNEGLDSVPRKVNVSTVSQEVKLEYVFPEVSYEITPGISAAKIYVSVGKNNTLNNTANNLEMKYWKADQSEATATKIYFSVTPQQEFSEVRFIENLKADTKYCVKFSAYLGAGEGYVEIPSDRLSPKPKTEITFTTLKELTASIGNKITMVADNNGDKSISVKLNISSTLIKDLENTINTITINVKNSENQIVSSQTFSYNGNGSTIEDFKKFLNPSRPDTTVSGNFTILANLSWKPTYSETTPDTRFIMDGSQYSFYYVITYKTGIDQDTVSTVRKEKINSWQGSGSYQIMRTNYEKISGSNMYRMRITLGGTDPRRVFEAIPQIEGGDTKYYVNATLELYKVTDEGNVKVEDSTQQVKMSYNIENGTMGTATYYYNDLAPGDTYIAYATINADFDNDGVYTNESYSYYDGGEYKIGKYTINSGKNIVPGLGDTVLNYVDIDPTNSKATFYGSGLGKADKIVFTLQKRGESYDAVEEGSLTKDDDSWTKNYVSVNYSENRYEFKFDNTMDIKTNYVLYVELWSGGKLLTYNSGTYEVSTNS